MTDHQIARRARKSKAFFAKRAEAAALAGNKTEALRLLTVARRKGTTQRLAQAVIVSGVRGLRDEVESIVYAALTTDGGAAPVRSYFSGMAEPGEIVTTTDGERWFHPYNGRKPVRLRKETA
jgi:hypothetical protein